MYSESLWFKHAHILLSLENHRVVILLEHFVDLFHSFIRLLELNAVLFWDPTIPLHVALVVFLPSHQVLKSSLGSLDSLFKGSSLHGKFLAFSRGLQESLLRIVVELNFSLPVFQEFGFLSFFSHGNFFCLLIKETILLFCVLVGSNLCHLFFICRNQYLVILGVGIPCLLLLFDWFSLCLLC